MSASIADWAKNETTTSKVARADAQNLCLWYNGRSYNAWSLDRLDRERDEIKTRKRRFRKILELARNGDLEDMFALEVWPESHLPGFV